MRLEIAAVTDKGSRRRTNEDNYYVNGAVHAGSTDNTPDRGSIRLEQKRRVHVIAVCDGMGGGLLGDEASRIAVESVSEFAGAFDDCVRAEDFDWAAASVIRRASAQISELAFEQGQTVGSTMALLAVSDNRAYVYHVGDSSILLYSGSELLQLTKPHTGAQALLDAGALTAEQAERSPLSNRLTRFLGSEKDGLSVSPSATDIPLRTGDMMIVCSDGVTGALGSARIRDILSKGASAWDTACALIEAAGECGDDNLTAIVVKNLGSSDAPLFALKLAAVVLLALLLLILFTLTGDGSTGENTAALVLSALLYGT